LLLKKKTSFITSRTEERDKERESKSFVLVSLLPFRVLSPVFFFFFFCLVKGVNTKGKLIGYLFVIERQQQKK